MQSTSISEFQAARPETRRLSFDNEVFDFDRFRDDVITYMNKFLPGDWKKVAEETDISVTTLKMFRDGYQCSLRTVCILSDWADLSIDSYRKRVFSG